MCNCTDLEKKNLAAKIPQTKQNFKNYLTKNKNTVVSHLFELALILNSRLIEVISVSLGFPLSSPLKFPSVIRTRSYSKFHIFEVISSYLGPKNSQFFEVFQKSTHFYQY